MSPFDHQQQKPLSTNKSTPEVSPHRVLTGMRSGKICGLLAGDVISKGNLGRFIHIRPNVIRQLKSKAAEREVPLHTTLEQLLETSLPKHGRLFPHLTVDRVV